jgi:hypothetical protein
VKLEAHENGYCKSQCHTIHRFVQFNQTYEVKAEKSQLEVKSENETPCRHAMSDPEPTAPCGVGSRSPSVPLALGSICCQAD